jgi:amino acid adenylation domain-containing protein
MSTTPSSESPGSRGRRLVAALPGFRELPRDAIEQSISACFERQVAEGPDREALRTPGTRLTYGELNARANRIAAEILERRGAAPEPAALLLSQSAALPAAILGALKAGKIYLPLDPAHPRAALESLIAEADPGLLLTDGENRALAESLAGNGGAVVDAEAAAARARESADPRLSVSPDAGACIFHTSGSTGRPKGVLDVHRNVLHNVRRYTNSLKIGPGDRLSLIQSCSFSGTVSTLFGALVNGAAVLLFDLRREGTESLARFLADQGATMFHAVPAIFRAVFGETRRRFADLRVVRLEGDQAFRHDAEIFRERLEPGCVLVNGLGATETGLTRQFFLDRVTRFEGDRIPVGYPVEDMEVRLLDETGHAAAPGEIGEVAVESRFLAAGYWKRPDLGVAAFLPSPTGAPARIYRTGDLGRFREDGCLELLGRRDFRMRIRGQRVDPGPVEEALRAIAGIREAIVAAQEDDRGPSRLVAYVVAEGTAPSAAALRRQLAATLPSAMVPSAFVSLPALPLDENGKVRRRGLPPPPRERRRPAASEVPRTRLERRLARAWQKTLGLEAVGIQDDFFELGGDSLSAARAAATIEKLLGRPVPPALIFARPTIEGLAAAIEEDAARLESEDPLLAIQPGGSRPPLFLVPTRAGELRLLPQLARRLGDDQPLYAYRWTGGGARRPPPRSVEEMSEDAANRIRAIQKIGPYRLGGLCFGAVVALETARKLRAEGESIALLALMAISPYDFPGLVTAEALERYLERGRRSSLAGRIAHHRGRLAARAPAEGLAYLFGRARSLPRFVRDRARRALSAAAGAVGDAGWSASRAAREMLGRPSQARTRDADRISRRAFAAHTATPDSGPVVVILAEKTRMMYSQDPLSDFRGLSTGRIHVEEIACHDGWLLVEPYVADLARRLRDHLDGAAGRAGGR